MITPQHFHCVPGAFVLSLLLSLAWHAAATAQIGTNSYSLIWQNMAIHSIFGGIVGMILYVLLAGHIQATPHFHLAAAVLPAMVWHHLLRKKMWLQHLHKLPPLLFKGLRIGWISTKTFCQRIRLAPPAVNVEASAGVTPS